MFHYQQQCFHLFTVIPLILGGLYIDKTKCYLMMLADEHCVFEVSKSGYIIKNFPYCLVTDRKICELEKNEFCAQELLGDKGILHNILPICRPLPNVCQAICRHTVNETSDILIAKTEVRKTTEDLKRTTSSEPIQKFLVTMPTAEMTNEPKSRISTAGLSIAMDRHQYCCYWAQAGECDNNKFFMRTSCSVSCGTQGANSL